MEMITGVEKSDALRIEADLLLTCLEPGLFSPGIREGAFTCRRNFDPPLVMTGHISRLTGVHRGYVLVFEDITEKKKIEEELFRATKHAGIGRLAAGVSHEIGNPLASISSLVQELITEDNAPFVKSSLVTINQHVERIARIVRSLGDFARLYPRQRVPTSLHGILDNTLDLVRYDRNFKKIKIQTAVEDVPPLTIDPDQIQQVFLNLILNARDAMPSGGWLTLRTHADDETVVVEVSDTGHGIRREHIRRIYDPFFTTKGIGKGTGLGLSVSYGIVQEHGGAIFVESDPGHGTTFQVALPAFVLPEAALQG